jgi:hypothetical protein
MFSKAATLFSQSIESVEIPYEGTILPCYFYRVDDNNNSVRSTLLAHGGFDSTLEELYTSAAAPALERGYNCLTFEGPGDGGVKPKQKISFRYDLEKVVTHVVDFALTRTEVDLNVQH